MSSSRPAKTSAVSRSKGKRKLTRYTDDSVDDEGAHLLASDADADLEAQPEVERIPLDTRPVRVYYDAAYDADLARRKQSRRLVKATSRAQYRLSHQVGTATSRRRS